MKCEKNYTMLFDFYEITMGNGYFKTGLRDRICYFDVFFRAVPDGGGFAIAAGLEQVVNYIQNLHFDEEDIAYLRSKGLFDEEFLEYLRTFRFTGDIWAVPEGTPVFPREPIMTVRAPAIEAQFIETYLLLTLNHQSLIATKASRIVRAAQGRAILNSVPAVRRVRMAPLPAHAALILRAVPAQRAQWQMSCIMCLQRGQWHIPGCRCLKMSILLLILIAVFIPVRQRCWWILIMC